MAARNWSGGTYSHLYLNTNGGGTCYTSPDQQPIPDSQPDPNCYCFSQPYTYADKHAHPKSYALAYTYRDPNRAPNPTYCHAPANKRPRSARLVVSEM